VPVELPVASVAVTATTPERTIVIDPDRWRSPADGPRWLYAEPGRMRAVWRLAVFGLAVLVVQPVTESIVAPLFGVLSRAMGERVEAYPWITLLSIVAALVLALRVVDRAPWRAVALDTAAWRPRVIGAGLALGAVAITSTMALLLLTRSAHVVTMGDTADGRVLGDAVWSTASWSATALRLAVLLAPAALWEELVFRGYLWTVAEDAGGRVVARWSTAVAFGVVHLLNPGAGVVSTVLVIVAGLCLGTLRERTGSVAAVWLAHFAWNWVMAAVLHVPVSGVPFDTPGYRIVVSGSAWWTGGPWGPEGGAAALLVLGGAWSLASRPTELIRRFRLSRTEMSAR
jgi:uncharacterized protein